MDRLKELKEAKQAAEEVKARLNKAVSSLDSARNWGVWDLFGGELFSSMIKRGKIRDANKDIKAITASLNSLNKELEDVNMSLPAELSDTNSDVIFDVMFDNIFTDMRVQSEIKESLVELKDFRSQIYDLIDTLDLEIKKLQ